MTLSFTKSNLLLHHLFPPPLNPLYLSLLLFIFLHYNFPLFPQSRLPHFLYLHLPVRATLLFHPPLFIGLLLLHPSLTLALIVLTLYFTLVVCLISSLILLLPLQKVTLMGALTFLPFLALPDCPKLLIVMEIGLSFLLLLMSLLLSPKILPKPCLVSIRINGLPPCKTNILS